MSSALIYIIVKKLMVNRYTCIRLLNNYKYGFPNLKIGTPVFHRNLAFCSKCGYA